ncbi:hypothetical protein TNCV_4379871 [Trichonephila clavipes]|nr:hypothetical protein TNCV_4379871 [Trichonephila clavipes]
MGGEFTSGYYISIDKGKAIGKLRISVVLGKVISFLIAEDAFVGRYLLQSALGCNYFVYKVNYILCRLRRAKGKREQQPPHRKPQTLQNVLWRKRTDVIFGANCEASFATFKFHAPQVTSRKSRECRLIRYVVVTHATCLTQSDRGPQNSPWQWARCTPVVSLEHHTDDSTILLGETPEEMIEHYDRWRHHLSPPPQLCMELKGREIFSSSLHS